MRASPILQGGIIYGVDSYGELRALEASTGDRLWESDQMTAQARWESAFMVRHGDRLLMMGWFTLEGY